MFNPASTTSNNLIYNQLFPYTIQTLQQLINNGSITHDQENILIQIIKDMLPNECSKIAMTYPNGIPSTDITRIINAIVNNAIQIYNTSYCQQSPQPQPYQNQFYQPQPYQNQFYQPQLQSFQPQSPTMNISKPEPQPNPEPKTSKCTIEKELIGADNNLDVIQKNIPYEKFVNLREFKDSYGIKYIISKIDFKGSAFNNDYEMILSFLSGNKDFTFRNINWLHTIKYKKFIMTDIPYDDFIQQYNQVRNTIIESSKNLNIDNILKVFKSQTYNFVIFFTNLIIEDINERLKRFLITSDRINNHFKIENMSDIDELYDLDLKIKDNPIINNALYKPTITKIVFNSFIKYFDKDSIGVFDITDPKQLAKAVFCDDLLYIGNQTKQQFMSNIIEKPDTIESNISELKKNSIFVTTEHAMLSNIIIPEFDQIQNNTYYTFNELANSEGIPIEEKTIGYKNNLEFLLAETIVDAINYNMYIVRNQNIVYKLSIGKTLDNIIFLTKA